MNRFFDVEAKGWSSKYDTSPVFQERILNVLRWIDERPIRAGKALDFGCGSGVFLAELMKRGYEDTGVDASQKMLDVSRASLEILKQTKGAGSYVLELSPENLEKASFAKKSFNLVICLGVLEYLDQPKEVLEILAKVLKPKGRLILSVPNRRSLLRGVESFVYKHPSVFRKIPKFSHLTGPDSYLHHQKHQFSRRELVNTLKTDGCRLVRTHYYVAPKELRAVAQSSLVGMSMLLEFEKTA